MNVTRFLAEVGDVLSDPNGNIYSTAEIIRHGDRQLRGLYRSLSEGSQQYSNFTMALKASDATQPMLGVFEYRLPMWVMTCRRVWSQTGSIATQDTYSVYRWSTGSVDVGVLIPKSNTAVYPTPRWEWQGTNTLRLYGYDSAQALVVEVLARPANMFKGKIATENADTDKLYLPQPDYGTLEEEEGAYINSDWQVTTTADVNATTFGEMRRCIYSTSTKIVAGVRYYEVVLDAPFSAALAQGDIIETVLAIPDEHTRVLVLATARACFQKKGNLKALEGTMSEYLQEMQRFQSFATTPRDSRGPINWKRRDPRQLPQYKLGAWPWSGWR